MKKLFSIILSTIMILSLFVAEGTLVFANENIVNGNVKEVTTKYLIIETEDLKEMTFYWDNSNIEDFIYDLPIGSDITIEHTKINGRAFIKHIDYSNNVNTLNNEETAGKCGENLFWTLNENGVVNILGTGNMYDYGMTNDDCSPWLGNDNVNSVIINEGVEGIGAWAFGYCDNLRSVHISKNVNVIGEAAFIQCDNLTDVYYSGDKQEWNKIDIWSSNNDLWNASNRQFNVNTDLYFEGNSDILSSLNNSETITNTEQKPNSFILSNSMENESDVPMVSLWDNNGAVIKVDGSL